MKKYKISEIAKMFNTTRTALIHYDKYGVLKPSFINEKNYRFYTTADIKRLEMIVALKESGLTLEEIKSYLNDGSSQSSIELLNRQKREIDQKIKSLKIQREIITKRVKQLSKFKDLEIYEGILLEDYPAIDIVKEDIGFGPLMNYSSAVNRLRNRFHKDGQLTSKYGVCYNISQKEGSFDLTERYIFDYLSDNQKIENRFTIPSSRYLRAIHRGEMERVVETIEKILQFADKEKLSIKSEIYYIPLYDFWESVSEEFIGEVLVAVE